MKGGGSMISIAICDDEFQELERAHSLLTRYIQEHPQYEITIHSFAAPLELLSFHKQEITPKIMIITPKKMTITPKMVLISNL